MCPVEHRGVLKDRINQLQASLKLIPHGPGWEPILNEMEQVAAHLERSYTSMPRWWMRRLRRAITSIYYRFRPVDLARLKPRPFEPFSATGLIQSLARVIGSSKLDRIELSAANFADWVPEDTRGLPGFCSDACFRRLHSSLFPGYARYSGGTGRCALFIEASRARPDSGERGRQVAGS